MDLKFNKSTGKEEKIKLDSKLIYASWVAGRALGGQSAEFEVATAFVGNGAPIKITGKSAKGKKLGKVDGKIRGNKFVGQLDIPADIEIGDEVWFEVKLSKNSLSGESDRIPAFPGPNITNLKWSAEEARRGDVLTLTADAKGLRDGTEVTITIYEHDQDGLHDKIVEFPATVEKEKIEIDWEYEYHEDTDEIPTESEVERYGRHYNPPEYFFTVKVEKHEYGKEQESGLLRFKDYLELELLDSDGQPIPDVEYVVRLPDGEEMRGRLDSSGRARLNDIPPGACQVDFELPSDTSSSGSSS
jgi:hypothetical protein